jgi:hypothetical protein
MTMAVDGGTLVNNMESRSFFRERGLKHICMGAEEKILIG